MVKFLVLWTWNYGKTLYGSLLSQIYLLHIQDFASPLYGCKTFSKLDLVKAYQQIPVNLADIPKTAVTTPFGAFDFFYYAFQFAKRS